MDKLYSGLGVALVLDGVVALIFQAWGLAGVLLVIGVFTVLVEVRARRRRIFQSKQGYATYEVNNSHGADVAQQSVMLHHQRRL